MVTSSENDLNLSDAVIVSGCIEGKQKFQEILYRRYFSYAMSIGIRYMANPDDAMELVNDGFLKVFTNLEKYDLSKPFKAWFAKIIVNTSIDYYRRNLRSNKTVHLDIDIEEKGAAPNVIEEINADDILQLFAQLPATYRYTFNLYEIEGYSHEEIAKMMKITTSTSRSNLSRAKQMLKELYKQQLNVQPFCHETL